MWEGSVKNLLVDHTSKPTSSDEALTTTYRQSFDSSNIVGFHSMGYEAAKRLEDSIFADHPPVVMELKAKPAAK